MFKNWDSDTAGNVPVQASAERPVARDEEQNRNTILTPSFAKRSSAQNSFILAEGEHSQNAMADQQRLQISEFHCCVFPSLSCWKTRFKIEVCSCSNFLAEAVLWIEEVEMADSVDDLKSSCSSQGYLHFPDFEMLVASIASSLNKIVQNSYFKKKGSLEEQKAQKADGFLRS